MNEQAETRLSTASMSRPRWARLRASAIAPALRLKAAMTGAETRGSAGAPVTGGCATAPDNRRVAPFAVTSV